MGIISNIGVIIVVCSVGLMFITIPFKVPNGTIDILIKGLWVGAGIVVIGSVLP
jgi:hypothetical protein